MERDEGLEELLRSDREAERGLTEKAMFGGRAWLMNGNLARPAHAGLGEGGACGVR